MSVESKVCSVCKQEKPASEFIKSKTHKWGIHCWCNPCRSLKQKEWQRKNEESQKEKRVKHYAENKEEIKERNKAFYEENKDTINHKRREQYQTDLKGKQEILEKNREYRKNNKQKLNDKQREKERRRMKEEPKFKVDKRMGSAIWGDLTHRGATKGGRGWQTLAGYTKDDLMEHLESQFKDGMTWDNYGTYWHIDHIVPKSWFKYESPDDPKFKECWALANLQPLEGRANVEKGSLYAGTPDNPVYRKETNDEANGNDQDLCGLQTGKTSGPVQPRAQGQANQTELLQGVLSSEVQEGQGG
jgi:hypothetical protein